MKSVFEEIFEVDDKSPSGLVWKVDSRNRKKGDVVGYVWQHPKCEHYKVWQCNLPKAFYEKHGLPHIQLVHRIIASIHYGDEEIIDKFVDHVDGNSLNNKVDNLKLCENLEDNNRNHRMQKNNKTGITGVSFNRQTNQYVAKAPQCKPKSFSINKYGESEAFRLACEARQQMLLELEQRGITFSDRHGV